MLGLLGTVYATTVVRPPDADPYNVVLVDLDDGSRRMSRVAGLAPAAVEIGLRVRVAGGDPPVCEPA